MPAIPAAPIQQTVTTTSITFTWAATDLARTFKVLRNGSVIATGASTFSYTDSSLTANTSYSYTLIATNVVGDSPASAALTVTTAPNKPLKPTLGSTTATSAVINWIAVDGATQYALYRGADLITANATGTSYPDTTVSAATTYNYTLTACNTFGCSAPSLQLSLTTSRYLKVCMSGQIAGTGTCPANPSIGSTQDKWACTKDAVTNLMWLNKTTDGGINDFSKTYTGYENNYEANNILGYLYSVNTAQNFCGLNNDWRLPSVSDYKTLDVARTAPRIDPAYFPNIKSDPGKYWSSEYNGYGCCARRNFWLYVK